MRINSCAFIVHETTLELGHLPMLKTPIVGVGVLYVGYHGSSVMAQ
jgi:hypothetical protein